MYSALFVFSYPDILRELYFRHIYARVQVDIFPRIFRKNDRIFPHVFLQGGPTIEQRFESYYNYCKLFNYILSADTPVNLELPNQWLWEIIDEFIYQFQVKNSNSIHVILICLSLFISGVQSVPQQACQEDGRRN